MADEATLHDTLVSEPEVTVPVAEATPAPEETVPDAPRIVETTNPEAAEIGRILLDSGWTRDQLNNLLEAPKALQALQYTLQNDPKDLITMLQRNNPQAAEKLLDVAADTYVDRYGDKGKASGKPSGDTNSDLLRELEALRETTNQLQARQQQQEQAVATASVLSRYNSRIDDLLNLKEVKELVPAKYERENLKARLNVELGADQSALNRVKAGNFVDVPKVFQKLIDEVAAEKKEAVKAAADKREQAKSNAYPEFQNGPNPFLPPDLVSKASDSWDSTESELAKAFERFAR